MAGSDFITRYDAASQTRIKNAFFSTYGEDHSLADNSAVTDVSLDPIIAKRFIDTVVANAEKVASPSSPPIPLSLQ